MKAIIKINKQLWTGWVKEQPASEEIQLEVQKGEKLDFMDYFQCSAVVDEISEDHVLLLTNGLALSKERGPINLNFKSDNLQTKINLGETVRLATQTMDSGATYTVSLVEIIK